MAEEDKLPTFDESFKAAVEQHSAPAERAAVPEPASSEPAQQTPDEPQAQAPVDDGAELLSKEEIEKLKDDPAKLEAGFKSAFTKKTQELAEQRKQLEPYQQLIRSYETDPKGTVKQLYEHFFPQQDATPKQAAQATNAFLDQLRTGLGPELSFLADRMAPALENLMQSYVGNQIAPVQERLEAEAAEREVNAELSAFEVKHPDWKQHEEKMAEIGRRFHPAPDPLTGQPPSTEEYMDTLYKLATFDISNAAKETEMLKRMTASAGKSESPSSGTPENRVAKTPAKLPTFEEAFADAKKGVRYEY